MFEFIITKILHFGRPVEFQTTVKISMRLINGATIAVKIGFS